MNTIRRGYCPHCKSIRHDHHGYREDASGAVWHYRKCQSCRRNYKLLVEPPPPQPEPKQGEPPESKRKRKRRR